MFNVYLHDKILQKAKEEEIKTKKKVASLSAELKFRESLYKKNKDRIIKRILEMSSDPVPISSREYTARFPEFKGECFMRHKPKNAEARIKDAEISNVWLDTVPLLSTTHNFRPRHKEKEINPEMKFKPKDRYERVAEAWQSQRGSINSTWEISEPSHSNNATERFPNKLRKSYYKTLESIALDLYSVSDGLPNLKKKHESEIKNDNEFALLAQEVMEKCKLKPIKMQSKFNSMASYKNSRTASQS